MSTNHSTKRLIARAGIPLVVAGLLLGGAGIASAHVTAHSPDQLTQGGDAEIVFRAPNESDTANFTKLEVDFSATSPIGDADVLPVPGWTYQVTMTNLKTPVKMADDTITSAVQSVVWTAQPGYAIKPGEFQQFTISVEGLPSNTTTMDMPAIQTYDDGSVIDWNQPTPASGQEPEHPLPHLTLVSADAAAAASSNATVSMPGMTTAAASSTDGTARWLGGIGLLLGALALGFGLGAYTRSRQAGGSGPGPDDGIDDGDDDDDDDLDDEAPPEGEKAKQGASA